MMQGTSMKTAMSIVPPSWLVSLSLGSSAYSTVPAIDDRRCRGGHKMSGAGSGSLDLMAMTWTRAARNAFRLGPRTQPGSQAGRASRREPDGSLEAEP
jgi:hypothetical protein